MHLTHVRCRFVLLIVVITGLLSGLGLAGGNASEPARARGGGPPSAGAASPLAQVIAARDLGRQTAADVSAGAPIGASPLGTTTFATVGFGWNSQHYPCYTSFTDPATLSCREGVDGPFVGAGDLVGDDVYMIDVDNHMWQIEATSGDILRTYEATAPPGSESYSGMAVDPTDGTVWVASTDLVTSSLGTIDPATGQAAWVGQVSNSPGLIAIAADGAGDLWGYDIVDDTWLAIDRVSAAGTVVGPLDFDADLGQGLGWDHTSDTLYMAAFNATTYQAELRTVDRLSGTTELVAVLGSTRPGGLNQLGWLGLATRQYLDTIFYDGFETGYPWRWSAVVGSTLTVP